MKHIMIGGPAAVLVALLIAAVVMARDKTHHLQAPREDVIGAAASIASVEVAGRATPRRFPTIVRAPCVPLPGHACWAGRVRLPVAVRDWWLQQPHEGTYEEEEEDEPDNAAGSSEIAVASGDAAIHEPVILVEAVWRAGPGEGAEPRVTEVVVATDGTFVAQLLPGTYDLQAVSRDDLLVAGVDGLRAIAGDTQGDLDLTLMQAVSLSGTVVDEYGITVEAELQIERLDQRVVRYETTGIGGGTFSVAGLRPGTYTVMAQVRGVTSPPVQLRAPGSDIVLRAPAALVGMLLVPARSDGGCEPRARLVMEAMDPVDAGAVRGVHFIECRALVWGLRAGSRWRVTGQLGESTIDQMITFGSGPTLPPVCLTGWCATDAATIKPRIACPEPGGPCVTPVYLLDGPADGPAKGERVGMLTDGFRAGFSYTFSAGDDRDGYANVSVVLVPGVNTIVFRPR